MDVRGLLADKISAVVKDLHGITAENFVVEHPSNESYGEYSTNVALIIAPIVKQSPIEIAKKIVYKLQATDLTFDFSGKITQIFDDVMIAAPGFINFVFSAEWLTFVLQSVQTESNRYGSSEANTGKTVLVEFSQPNPNKPMHIGHSRNNFLGSSLSNIYAFAGYHVIKANYMNDWGTHICKSMLMYQKYGNGRQPDKKADHFVGDFYKMYEEKAESEPKLNDELAEMFRQLEGGDPETTALWKRIVNWAYEGWQQTYANENVEFDIYQYQHDYKDSGKEIVDIAIKRGIAEKDPTGAVIARLQKYGIPDKVLLRSDGTSVYSTQDLQLAKDSFEKYKLDKRFYVVDYRQSDYFKQVFKILNILGFDWAGNLFHVAYGTVDLPEGKMSSRLGRVVNADEVFDRLVELESEEIKKSVKAGGSTADTIKKVALAAYRYGMLKVDSKQDIVFNFDQLTRFEGNTGPYLLYTYARAHSILEKAGLAGERAFEAEEFSKYALLPRERSLLVQICKFPEIVQDAVDKMAPSLIANYVYDLAQKYNSFYADVSVLSAEDDEKKRFRLGLTRSTAQVLENGLNLLGIKVVEKM